MKNSHRHDLFAPWTSSTHSGHGHTMKYRIVRGGGSELAGRPSSSGRGAVLLPSVTRPPTREKTRSEMWSRPAAAASPPLPPTNAGFLSELEKKEHSHRRLLLMSEAVERRRLPPPVVLATKAASLGRCSSASGPTPSASSAGISRETSLPRSTGRFARSGGSLRGIDTCISSDPDDLWRDDDARTLQLVESLKYTKAYLAVSALLPSYTHHTAHLAVLRARRASCSYALMNYRECIEDCQLCIQCWRDASIISGGGAGHIIDGLDLVAVIRFWARSLLMREEYGEAEYLLNRLTSGSAASGPMESMLPQIGPTPQHEFVELCGCLPAVEAFRSNITAEDWSTALAFVKDAMPVIGDSPLRTLHAIALLELGQVDPVREMLLPYLPQIPTPFGEGEDISPEDRQLHSNMDGHYLLATILLAKASAYSGRPYMNISAELTKRCLQYNPRYAPAIAVGNYLVLMEDYLAQIDECFALGSFDAAVALISEAMRLDSTNHRIQAHLLHRRAEAAMALRRPINTIDDCTHSLNLDPGGAATYMLRAHAYDAVQRHCEAAADRARAVELNPSYEAVIREEDEARRRRAAEEAAREQQRKQQKQRLFEQQQQQRQAQQQQQQQQREAAAARAPKTLYDVLGLPRTAHVTEIRARFKQLTLQCHPDKVVSRPLGEQQTALETFKSVNNAYAILSDADKRSEYDRTLATP